MLKLTDATTADTTGTDMVLQALDQANKFEGSAEEAKVTMFLGQLGNQVQQDHQRRVRRADEDPAQVRLSEKPGQQTREGTEEEVILTRANTHLTRSECQNFPVRVKNEHLQQTCHWHVCCTLRRKNRSGRTGIPCI